jgi:hypothetical protein
LTIEFTRTHQELTLTAGETYVFRPPSGTCPHWIRVRGTENILKTLNTKSALASWKLPTTPSWLSLVVIFTQSIQLSNIVCV